MSWTSAQLVGRGASSRRRATHLHVALADYPLAGQPSGRTRRARRTNSRWPRATKWRSSPRPAAGTRAPRWPAADVAYSLRPSSKCRQRRARPDRCWPKVGRAPSRTSAAVAPLHRGPCARRGAAASRHRRGTARMDSSIASAAPRARARRVPRAQGPHLDALALARPHDGSVGDRGAWRPPPRPLARSRRAAAALGLGADARPRARLALHRPRAASPRVPTRDPAQFA